MLATVAGPGDLFFDPAAQALAPREARGPPAPRAPRPPPPPADPAALALPGADPNALLTAYAEHCHARAVARRDRDAVAFPALHVRAGPDGAEIDADAPKWQAAISALALEVIASSAETRESKLAAVRQMLGHCALPDGTPIRDADATVIGAGEGGTVIAARGLAVKIAIGDEAEIAREAALAAALNSLIPGVAPAPLAVFRITADLSAGEQTIGAAIAMELVHFGDRGPATSLKDAIVAGRATQEQAQAIVDKVKVTLAWLDAKFAFVHADLHADNVLVSQDLALFKLIDFGRSSAVIGGTIVASPRFRRRGPGADAIDVANLTLFAAQAFRARRITPPTPEALAAVAAFREARRTTGDPTIHPMLIPTDRFLGELFDPFSTRTIPAHYRDAVDAFAARTAVVQAAL